MPARRPKLVQHLFVWLWLACGIATAGGATHRTPYHPISVTEALVFVSRDKISASVGVFAEDLYLFHNLQPNMENFLAPGDVKQGIEKHKNFLLERFIIRDLNGERINGRVVEVKEFEMKPEALPMGDLMQYKLTYVLEYPLDEPPPFLTISQEMVDDTLGIPAEMQLRLKQAGSDAPFYALLNPGQPETIPMDWEKPALSADATDAEWDAWIEEQREKALGITSYSSVYSFIYIEDHEVRHEVLVPLLSIEQSVLVARDDDAFLDLDEQAAAAHQIGQFFKARNLNPLKIDGIPVTPTVERLDFFGLDFKDFAMQAEPRKVSLANGRVGIILSYPTKGRPERVDMKWTCFNESIWTVQSVVYADKEAQRAAFARYGDDNVYTWESPGAAALPHITQLGITNQVRRVPVVSFVLLAVAILILPIGRLVGQPTSRATIVAAGLAVLAVVAWPGLRWEWKSERVTLSEEESQSVFATLHKNIYRAFDYRDEGDVYDALANSVDGDLLQQLYLQIQKGLEMQEQGGAISRIREVTIVGGRQVPSADGSGFTYRCSWTVKGTVEHWGHIHARTNQYEAVFDVQPRNDAWKITSVEVLNEKRVKFETSLRGV